MLNVDLELAKRIGLEEAVFIGYLKNRLKRKRCVRLKEFEDGFYYQASFKQLYEELPFLSEHKIKRIVYGLQNKGVLVSRKFGHYYANVNYYSLKM